MKIRELTVKKTVNYKNTIKEKDGSYKSEGGEAEYGVVVEGKDIDGDEVIELVKRKVQDVLDPDPKWLQGELKGSDKDE